MTIKANALDLIEQKMKERSGGDGKQQRRLERMEELMRWIMSEEKGREFLYEYVANGQALHMEPYTGNAATYFILGYQKWPKELLECAKRTSLNGYHKMEVEALQRQEDK